MTQNQDLVTSIMKDTDIATLTWIDDQGRLVSVPMGTQDFEDPGTVHFLTPADTDKVREIAERPEVNVAYAAKDGWVSLSGTAHRNDDRELLRELWDTSASAFMPGGPEDPGSTLLTVTADTAHYWEAPGKAALVVEMAKGVMTDRDPEPGSTGTVSL